MTWKNFTRITSLLFGLLLVPALVGCGKAPDAEVKATVAAVDEARRDGADRFAQDRLRLATELLDSARQSIETQKQSLFQRDYSKSKDLLARATSEAKEAGAQARVATEAAQQGLAQVEAQAKAAVAQATKDAAESEINRIYAAWQKAGQRLGSAGRNNAEMTSAMADLKKAQAAMKADRYDEAVAAAQAAEGKINSAVK